MEDENDMSLEESFPEPQMSSGLESTSGEPFQSNLRLWLWLPVASAGKRNEKKGKARRIFKAPYSE